MCNKDSLPYSISATSNSACQGVETNQVASLPLTALLIDQENSGASVAQQPIVFAVDNAQDTGIPSVWSTESGNWSTSTTVMTTDVGFASVLVKAGTANGCFKIEARQVQAENTPAVFTLKVGTGMSDNTEDVNALLVVEGDRQAAFLNDKVFPSPLVVKALDVHSLPVSNAQISFHIIGSTGCKLQPSSPVFTDVGGLTPEIQVVVGEQPGLFTVVAKANGKEATFDLALAPKESQFQFFRSNGTTIQLYQGLNPPQSLGISLLDLSGNKWPYINVYALVVPSNFTFPEESQPIGPCQTALDGSVPLPGIYAKEGDIKNGYLSVWVDNRIRETYTLEVRLGAKTPTESKADFS
ncbi:Uncharacterised protein [Burkholderia pseudomallei]|nr:Uncharacterised protein [Burkholderia pseudomallei]CAK0457717.1 Uncharacterised protein [Burkholderia pseudomallei]